MTTLTLIFSKPLMLEASESLFKSPIPWYITIQGESEPGDPINAIKFGSIDISWGWFCFG